MLDVERKAARAGRAGEARQRRGAILGAVPGRRPCISLEADIDGSLALGVTAESAQDIARPLEKAASEMRLAL